MTERETRIIEYFQKYIEIISIYLSLSDLKRLNEEYKDLPENILKKETDYIKDTTNIEDIYLHDEWMSSTC